MSHKRSGPGLDRLCRGKDGKTVLLPPKPLQSYLELGEHGREGVPFHNRCSVANSIYSGCQCGLGRVGKRARVEGRNKWAKSRTLMFRPQFNTLKISPFGSTELLVICHWGVQFAGIESKQFLIIIRSTNNVKVRFLQSRKKDRKGTIIFYSMLVLLYKTTPLPLVGTTVCMYIWQLSHYRHEEVTAGSHAHTEHQDTATQRP